MKVCTSLQHPDECEQEKKNKQMGLELLMKTQNCKYITNCLLWY